MIGVLALQGDYEKHIRILKEINISSVEIKYPDQLKNIDGLIIPGGESTTMSDLMMRINFQEYLIKFSQEKPIMGTCAGLIMMSKTIQNNNKIKPLGVLDIEVNRNAYGRQVNSFMDTIDIEIDEKIHQAEVLFIRAPKINKVGKSVSIISKYHDDIIAVRSGIHFGFTFHPELNKITFLHHYIFSKNMNYHKENNAA